MGARRYLVVANDTLGGEHLHATLAEYAAAGPASFHVLVPATDAGATGAARRLDQTLQWLQQEVGATATGEVVTATPVDAVAAVLQREEIDEIVLSTLPVSRSAWVRDGVPYRLQRTLQLPFTHVIDAGGAAGAPVLELRGLSKTFVGQRALTDVSLTLVGGEVRALVGANGSGKSTLVKILAGVHHPDVGGSMRIDGQPVELPMTPARAQATGLRFVHQDLGLVERRPVIENLVYGRPFLRRRFGFIDWQKERDEARALLDEFHANFGLDELVGRLNRAQQAMVAIMRALNLAAVPMSVLVLDEPTVGLPAAQVDTVLGVVESLRRRGVAVLLVSHALNQVERSCENVTVLRDGSVVLDGPLPSDRAELVEAITGHRPGEGDDDRAAPVPDGRAAAIDIRNLVTAHLHGVDLWVAPGEIVGVAGDVESGVDDVLPALYGDLPADFDTFEVSGRTITAPHSPRRARRAGMAYLPAKRASEAAITGMSLLENLSGGNLEEVASRLRIRRRDEVGMGRTLTAQFAIRPPRLDAPIETFSGGNQQKVMLARWFRTHPGVVLIDEPTQGVDIGAKQEVHHHILTAASEGAAVLIKASEVEELETLCNRIIVLRKGRVATALTGDRINAAAVMHAMFDEPPTAEGSAA